MLSTFQSAAPIMAVEPENDHTAQHTDSQWSLPSLAVTGRLVGQTPEHRDV